MHMESGSPLRGARLEKAKRFLAGMGLDWDDGIETTVCLLDGGEIIASGSRQGKVLKCIAVSPEREGEGLTATVVTELVREAMVSGQGHLFLFTKPGNVEKFRGVGFYPVCETNEAALLENRRDGITRFVAGLENPAAVGAIGSIVANCNPFTNGHRYLVEHAAARCVLVHLFILSENKSRFSTVDRLELARRGVADLNNVVVHPTSDYLISSATFPDYFLKDKVRAKEVNCRLDLQIFAERFAAPLGITVRFVGTEPTCRVTSTYNQQMKTVLPPLGVEVVEVPRRELEGEPISASRVRRLLEQGHVEQCAGLVPPSTYEYLLSL